MVYGAKGSANGGTGGMATTFSGVDFQIAYRYHIGDSRLYRWQNGRLECLTNDHRVQFGGERSYTLSGHRIDTHLEIDFRAFRITSRRCIP